LHSRKNKSVREIARITGLSRNTISKWLTAEIEGAPKYRRGEQSSKLTAFHDALRQALKADARRPRHERRTARALYAEIKAAGYDGGYSRVTDFIRAWRQDEGQAAVANAFIPLAFELGEAYQFDWSEEGMVVGGIYYRVQVAHMKLCASRAFWLVAYPSQGHEMLFDAHTRSFAALGGIPRRGIYDNMKTAVDKVKKGKGRVVNERFATMCAHYLVDPDFCNVASGWEKGVVVSGLPIIPSCGRRIFPTHLSQGANDGSGSSTGRRAGRELRCTGPEGPVQRGRYGARVPAGHGGTDAWSAAVGGGSRAAVSRSEHLRHRPRVRPGPQDGPELSPASVVAAVPAR
jgi:transposase